MEWSERLGFLQRHGVTTVGAVALELSGLLVEGFHLRLDRSLF